MRTQDRGVDLVLSGVIATLLLHYGGAPIPLWIRSTHVRHGLSMPFHGSIFELGLGIWVLKL